MDRRSSERARCIQCSVVKRDYVLLTVDRLCNAWEHCIHLYSMRQFRDLMQFSRTMGKPSIQYTDTFLMLRCLENTVLRASCIDVVCLTAKSTRRSPVHSSIHWHQQRHAPPFNMPSRSRLHWRRAFICGSYCNISIKTATARAARRFTSVRELSIQLPVEKIHFKLSYIISTQMGAEIHQNAGATSGGPQVTMHSLCFCVFCSFIPRSAALINQH